MTDRIEKQGLKVATELAQFIDDSALPGTGIDSAVFWKGFADLIAEMTPRNRAMLKKRDDLQATIDDWHVKNRGHAHDRTAYEAFLRDIGYLVEDAGEFEIETTNVDPEIATVPGPQLVVPITNARFALNAANARWGSLYDAFYGTDAMGVQPPKGPYDRGHGARVVARFVDAVLWALAARGQQQCGHCVSPSGHLDPFPSAWRITIS